MNLETTKKTVIHKRDAQLHVNHLRTFRSVASHLSFTRAAQELNVTQPAVTHQIHALQRYFGVKLVEVVGRRVVLTEAARFRRPHRPLMDRLTAWEREMSQYVNAERGELHRATVTIGAARADRRAFPARSSEIELNVTIESIVVRSSSFCEAAN